MAQRDGGRGRARLQVTGRTDCLPVRTSMFGFMQDPSSIDSHETPDTEGREVQLRRVPGHEVRDQPTSRRGLRQSEMTVTEGVEDPRMPRRRPDDWKTVRVGRALPHPGRTALTGQLGQIATRGVKKRVRTRVACRRCEAGEFGGATDAQPNLKRRGNEFPLGKDQLLPERDRRLGKT